MQRYHLEVKGVPEYINMLEDAQRQSGRAGRTIADDTLLVFARTTMLTTEKFLRANNDWEERAEKENTWTQWNVAYKKAHTQARLKAQANDGTEKFGAANSVKTQQDLLVTINWRWKMEASRPLRGILVTFPPPWLMKNQF